MLTRGFFFPPPPLLGTDFKPGEELEISKQVARLIDQATNLENLCQHYIGMPLHRVPLSPLRSTLLMQSFLQVGVRSGSSSSFFHEGFPGSLLGHRIFLQFFSRTTIPFSIPFTFSIFSLLFSLPAMHSSAILCLGTFQGRR